MIEKKFSCNGSIMTDSNFEQIGKMALCGSILPVQSIRI